MKLALLPGGGLTSTSIPLLWNSDVSTTTATGVYGVDPDGAGPLVAGGTPADGSTGCFGFNGGSPIAYPLVLASPGGLPLPTLGASVNTAGLFDLNAAIPGASSLGGIPGHPGC